MRERLDDGMGGAGTQMYGKRDQMGPLDEKGLFRHLEQLVEVVGDGHQVEFPLNLAQAAQPESPKPQVRLQVANHRLYALAPGL